MRPSSKNIKRENSVKFKKKFLNISNFYHIPVTFYIKIVEKFYIGG